MSGSNPTAFTPETAREARAKAAPRGPNKTTLAQREALLAAAADGHDDGLLGYYLHVKATMPDKFEDAMRALMPKTVDGTLTITLLEDLVAAAGAKVAERMKAMALDGAES